MEHTAHLPVRASRRALLLLAVALIAAGAPTTLAHGNSWSAQGNTWSVTGAVADVGERARVVVQGMPGAADAVADAVRRVGGTVGATLSIVDGVVADLPASQVDILRHDDAVRAVTPNSGITFESFTYGDDTTGSAFVGSTGAGSAWAGGNKGAGVGVAVIDTGTSPMPDFSGRLVHGPDLSGEGSIIDTYGHGTVMSGLVGGSGADSASTGAYTGVAPKAHVVSVKVAGRNGVTDVSTVLQAMHWVSAYKDQYNIRVLNLSWGTASTQDPSVDPLNYAVQRLWRQGIVVVVAAGNSGPDSGTIRKPADDPVVLTVGAYDDKGNTNPTDDQLPKWTSRGPTPAGVAKPDVVAPGRTVVAQRSYGSSVESDNAKALVSPSYIKGSGSSQAAAVTSGLAALLVAARPELTPDQVKSLLTRTASPLANESPTGQGAGRISLAAALTADPGPAQWQATPATGLGSLEASRGGRNIETDCGNDGTIDVIRGEITAQCQAWNGGTWTGGTWTGGTWTGGTWTGGTWTGGTWTGGTWTGGTWTASLYGDDYVEFLNAFWGERPKYSQNLPGEVSENAPAWGRESDDRPARSAAASH